MQLGMVGLGRMGANMVRRLMQARPRVRGLRRHRRTRSRRSPARARPAPTSLDGLRRQARRRPRSLWLMVPAAFADDDGRRSCRRCWTQGDVDHRRRQLLLPRRHRPRRSGSPSEGIHYVDVGTSGGVFGLERGYCLMIGGADEAVDAPRPDLRGARARASTSAPRTPGRDGRAAHRRARLSALRAQRRRALREDGPQRDRVRDHGRLRRGPRTSCKNAERRQARAARPTPRPRRSSTRSTTSTTSTSRTVAEVWRRGSVIGSWLLDLTAQALQRVARPGRVRRPGVRLRARAAGRSHRRRSTRACPPTCSRRRSTSGSPRAATADFADKCCRRCARSSAGHAEKTAGGPRR